MAVVERAECPRYQFALKPLLWGLLPSRLALRQVSSSCPLAGPKTGRQIVPPIVWAHLQCLTPGLQATGVGRRTVSGLLSPARGFADDLVLITRSCGDMSRLLEAVAGFCAWSGMRIKREKSVITGFQVDYDKE